MRFARSILAAALCAAGSGCFLRPAPFSPLLPISPLPATVGEAIDSARTGWPEPKTFQAQGDLTIQGEGVRGKERLGANLLYAAPDRARLRASKMPVGTVFEALQIGDAVDIKLNRERLIFRGTIDDLAARPGALGAVRPRDVIHAILIGQRAAAEMDQAKDSARLARFDGDRAVLEGADGMEEYVVRRRDGLIEEARLYEPGGGGRRLALVVEYKRWIERDGMVLPSQMEIRSEEPRTRVDVRIDATRFDPPLGARVFEMPAEPGVETRPLSELFEAPMPDEEE